MAQSAAAAAGYPADWVPYGNGGFAPPGHPAAGGAAPNEPAAAPAAPAALPASPNSSDPFASLGGGIQTANGGWLPPGMQPGTGTPQSPGNPLTNPNVGAGPAAPSGTGQPAPPTTPTGAPLATNAAQISSPFYQTLHGILSQTTPVTENDPQVKNVLNAARSEEERNFARQRGMMAERAAAEGTSMSGAFDAQLAGARSGIGARMGGLAASEVKDQQSQRMAQIISALQIAGPHMTESERNMLQRELANLDASLRQEGFGIEREQIAAGREEGDAERELRRYLGDQSTGFNYAQLGQQGDQFGEQLGANVGMHNDELANRLLLALISGGEV